MKEQIQQRLARLRALMAEQKIDAFLANGSDPHMSEYVQDSWKSREYVSGFTGSYGWIAVTQTEAVLWTDSRYYLQAERELEGTGFEMLKARLPETIPTGLWLAQRLQRGQTVGFDGSCYPLAEVRELIPFLFENELNVDFKCNLLDSLWTDRPQAVRNSIFEHPLEVAGETRASKLSRIRVQMHDMKADVHFIAALDEIAWTFNLRGSDVEYNPVFMAYAIIESERALLFLNRDCVSESLQNELISDGIQLFDYDQFFNEIEFYIDHRILFDPAKLSFLTYKALASNNSIVEASSITDWMKAVKNEAEIAGFRKAMLADGVALIDFQLWLNQAMAHQTITEYDVAEKLGEFRAKQPGFVGESFHPIVGYAANGAVVHYHVTPELAATLKPDSLLLFDSGGQYQWGTTDITRTVPLTSEPTAQMKTDFTLVLKGVIGLTSIQFPHGTLGCHLDVLARKAMWERGLNYGHGTGHGVGAFLNVHEGPMSIRGDVNKQLIVPGMVMSNEPGLYRTNSYGLRIENMMVCVEKQQTEFGTFYGFDTLTRFPIDTRLVDVALLDASERQWLNAYQKLVYAELSPLCDESQRALLEVLTKAV